MYRVVVVGAKLKESKTMENVYEKILSGLKGYELIELTRSTLLEEFVSYPQYVEEEDILTSIDTKFKYSGNEYQMTLSLSTYKEGVDLYTLQILVISDNVDDESIFEVKKGVSIVFQRSFANYYWQLDTHNEEISSNLYKKIHNVENNMRNLVITFMLKRYGIEWFEDNILPKYRNKSKEFNEWYMSSPYQTFKKVSSELFNLQIIDLINMLQESYPSKFLNIVKEEVNGIIHKLNDNSNKIISIDLKHMVCIWDDNKFDDILGEGFVSEWYEFSKLRNIIAHNKLVCTELYNDISEKVQSLNDKINNGRTLIDSKTTSLERSRKRQMINDINTDFLINDAQLNEYTVEELIEELKYSDAINNFYSNIEEYEYDTKSIIEDLLSNIELISEIDFNEYDEKRQLISFIIKMLQYLYYEDTNLYESILVKANEDLLNDLYESLLIKLLDRDELVIKQDAFSSTDIDSFDYDVEIIISDIFRDVNISIRIYGYILPLFGDADELRIELKCNNNIEVVGNINIQYGDYEVDEDTGTGIASEEQFIYYNIDEVNGYILDMIKKIKN